MDQQREPWSLQACFFSIALAYRKDENAVTVALLNGNSVTTTMMSGSDRNDFKMNLTVNVKATTGTSANYTLGEIQVSEIIERSLIYTTLPRRVFHAMPFTRSSAWKTRRGSSLKSSACQFFSEENLSRKVIYTIEFTSARKVGGMRDEARSRGRSSPDPSAF